MLKKILIIEVLVIAAILVFNWSANRGSAPVGAASVAPASPEFGHEAAQDQSDNTVDLERPPFLDELN